MEELDPWEQDYTPTDQNAPAETDPWEQDYSEPVVSPETNVELEEKRAAVLPKPRPNMFADMADEEAAAVYDAYRRHPESQTDEEGNVLYRGVSVPKAEGNSPFVEGFVQTAGRLFGGGEYLLDAVVEGEIPKLSEALAGGVLSGARSVGTGLASVGEAIGILPEGSLEATEDFLPNYNPEGTLESFGKVGGQVGLGVVAGNKVGALASGINAVRAAAGSQAAARVATRMPKAIKYVANIFAKNFGGAVGTGATLPGDTDTLAVGDNAILQTGIGFDQESESDAVRELEGRANVIMDNLLVAFPVEAAADGGKKLFNAGYELFLKPLVGVGNQGVQEKIVFQQLLEKVYLSLGATMQEQKAIIDQEIQTILRDPKNRRVIFGGLPEGIDDVDLPLDTVSTIERGMAGSTDEASELLKESLRRQRTGVIEAGAGGQTKMAVERPARELDRLTTDAEQVFGGDEAIEASAQRFQRVAEEQVGQSRAGLQETSLALDTAETGLPDVIRKDGPLGAALGDVADETGSRTAMLRDEAAGEMIGDLDKGTGLIREQKNQLWADLPDNIPFDEESFAQAVTRAEPFLSRGLKEQIEGVTDFKSLQNLRNSLNKEVNRLKSGNSEGVDELLGVLRNVKEDQVDFVRRLADEQGDIELGSTLEQISSEAGEAKSALDDALTYQKDVYGKTQKGIVKDVEATRGKFGFDDVSREDAARDVLQKGMTSQYPARINHLVETISRPEYSGKADRVVDYFLADVSDKLRTKIKAGGLGELDVQDVLQTLQSYRQAVRNFPELSGRLDDFENNLIKAKGDVKSLEGLLDVQKQDVAKIEADVYDGVFKDFYDKVGADFVPRENAFQSFKALLQNPHGLGKIRRLVKMAKDTGDETVMDGMKAAYGRVLDDFITSNTPTATGAKSLSSPKIAQALSGSDAILQHGDVVFGDSPKFMEAIRGLMDVTLDANAAKKIKADGGMTDLLRNAVASRNQLVLAFIGPLTRWGARINALTGRAFEYMSPNNAAAVMKDKMFADPDEFLRVWGKIQEEGLPSNEAARQTFMFLYKMGVLNEADSNEFERAYLEVNSGDQTLEAFSE